MDIISSLLVFLPGTSAYSGPSSETTTSQRFVQGPLVNKALPIGNVLLTNGPRNNYSTAGFQSVASLISASLMMCGDE